MHLLASSSLVGPQAMTLAIPLGTFILALIVAFFGRRRHA